MKTLLINSVKFSCNIVVYLPCIMRLVVIFSCNNVVLLYYCAVAGGESIDLAQGRKHARDTLDYLHLYLEKIKKSFILKFSNNMIIFLLIITILFFLQNAELIVFLPYNKNI